MSTKQVCFMPLLKEIHQLIQSLSPKQKNYFTESVSQGSNEEKDFFFLYLILSKSKFFSLNFVQNQFKKNNRSYSSQIATYLQSRLCDVLFGYHSKEHGSFKSQMEINKIQTLIRQDLQEIAMTQITQIKALLKYKEDYRHLLQILNLEQKVRYEINHFNIDDGIEQINQEIEACFEKLRQEKKEQIDLDIKNKEIIKLKIEKTKNSSQG